MADYKTGDIALPPGGYSGNGYSCLVVKGANEPRVVGSFHRTGTLSLATLRNSSYRRGANVKEIFNDVFA